MLVVTLYQKFTMKNLSFVFASSVFALSVFSSPLVMAQAAAPAAPATVEAPAAAPAPKKPVNTNLNNARVKAAVVASLVSDKKKELDKEKAAPTPDAAKVDKMTKDLAVLEKRLVAANAVAASAEKSK